MTITETLCFLTKTCSLNQFLCPSQACPDFNCHYDFSPHPDLKCLPWSHTAGVPRQPATCAGTHELLHEMLDDNACEVAGPLRDGAAQSSGRICSWSGGVAGEVTNSIGGRCICSHNAEDAGKSNAADGHRRTRKRTGKWSRPQHGRSSSEIILQAITFEVQTAAYARASLRSRNSSSGRSS